MMEKDVLISLKNKQSGGAAGDDVQEVITEGQYYLKDDRHYVIYDEHGDDGKTCGHNIIKVSDSCVEIIRSGDISAHMVFEPGKKSCSCYNVAPYGSMTAEFDTNRVEIREEEDGLSLLLDYSLKLNQSYVSDCLVDIRIESASRSDLKPT